MKLFKKICTIVVSALLIIILCGILINIYVCFNAKKYFLTQSTVDTNNFDCILVLGCGLNKNGEPSKMLADRLDTAFSVYKNGTKLLLSGDNGQNDYDEVTAMAKYLIKKGVLEEDIQKDHAGFSTYESMYRAKEVFMCQNILIVTQKYHLYRAVFIARHLGINAYGLYNEGVSYNGQFIRDVRETIARSKDFFFCIFKPKPTFLGDPIPIA